MQTQKVTKCEENAEFCNLLVDIRNYWGYYGPAYKKLAPKWKETYEPYRDGLERLKELKKDVNHYMEYVAYKQKLEDDYLDSYYETRLKTLNIKLLFEELEARFGREIILLCHEDIYEFCHRRVDADWIFLETGIYIPELAVTENGKIYKLPAISYVDKLKKYR